MSFLVYGEVWVKLAEILRAIYKINAESFHDPLPTLQLLCYLVCLPHRMHILMHNDVSDAFPSNLRKDQSHMDKTKGEGGSKGGRWVWMGGEKMQTTVFE